VSASSDFSGSKTDNFKVKVNVPATGTLNVNKFYDANANGVNDDGQLITGWKIRIIDDLELFRFTPVSVIVAPDDYVVSEFDPAETNWIHTTPNPVNVTVDAGETETVRVWQSVSWTRWRSHAWLLVEQERTRDDERRWLGLCGAGAAKWLVPA
jgi:hypothetical protein